MSEVTKTTFATLPREIRDLIYKAILINVSGHLQPCPPLDPQYHEKEPIPVECSLWRGVPRKSSCRQSSKPGLNLGGLPLCQSFRDLIDLVHEWAPVSAISREAYAAFYTNNTFKMDFGDISQLATTSSKPILHLTPMMYLRDVIIDIESQHMELLYSYLKKSAPTSMVDSNLLNGLLKCPLLRKVHVTVSIAHTAANACIDASAVLMGISPIYKKIQKNIGLSDGSNWRSRYPEGLPLIGAPEPGLRVCLRQTRFQSEHWYDITWMWDPPDEQARKRVKDGSASSEELIRVLIADGEVPGDPKHMLDRFREVANNLYIKGEEFAQAWFYTGLKRIAPATQN